jgi:hypothetical protein
LGDRVALAGQLLVFDQAEVTAQVGLQKDLYAFSVDDGRKTRLTTGTRAADPDVAPDGRTLVFTIQREDRRDISMAPFEGAQPSIGTPKVLASAVATEFTSPRWSPDGRRIAVERRVRGSLPEIVILDVSSGSLSPVACSAAARCVSPAWMPDGRLLFASNRNDGPFRLYAVDLTTGAVERLEGTGPSAQSPDVSPDGRTIVFVGYTPAGYDLFTIPLATARWSRVEDESLRYNLGSAVPLEAPGGTPDREYRPWATLAPRFWTPTVGSDGGEIVGGAAIGGADALGRHAYAADVRWATSRARPDWGMSYAYDRWRPTLFISAADDTDPFRSGETRSTEANAGALVPWRRVRWTQSVLGAFHAATDTVACLTCPRPIDEHAKRRSIRTGYAFSSARRYGYSISREEGWSLTASNELIARGLGSDGNGGAIVADLRAYQRAGVQHAVLAARMAGAHSWGDDSVRRRFTETGNGPQSGGFLFDEDAIGLLRGFDDRARGSNAVVVNLDYRFPLMRIERGAGTLPGFVRAVHGAVFADAGHSWNEAFRLHDARASIGLELSVDTILGYSLPVTLTSGVAWRHDGLTDRDSGAVFARVGYAF